VADLGLEGLTCEFDRVAAVAGIDLAVREGELVSLLGPSGCGKTTTLRLIAGFLEPSAGRILSNGRELSRPGVVVPPERRGMSMIFQSYAVWPNMTVGQNVAFGLEVRRLPKPEIDRRVMRSLASVRLDAFAERYPSELSGGQQQRVALARALVIEPQILLLDEPLSNLDAQLRETMRAEIRRLHDEFRITTIYVTHDQAEAMAISDRIAVMNDGRIEQCDTPWTIYNSPRTRFVAEFVGRSNIVTGLREGDRIRLFAPVDGTSAGAPCLCSVRPEAIALHPASAGIAGAAAGRIARRTYCGDRWEYDLAVTSGGALRVTAAPSQRYEVGENVLVAIDPAAIVPISEG
jgi:iron(III) transport system ATP-binding protein